MPIGKLTTMSRAERMRISVFFMFLFLSALFYYRAYRYSNKVNGLNIATDSRQVVQDPIRKVLVQERTVGL